MFLLSMRWELNRRPLLTATGSLLNVLQFNWVTSQIKKSSLHKFGSVLALLPKPPGPSAARDKACSKIYGQPNFSGTGGLEHANGSFVISECNNCKGRWSCVSGLFNQSYLLGVINTLITVATRTHVNLCTRKVIIKPSKCHPLEPLTGVGNVNKNIFC